jgi:hypothetical protein
MNDKEEKLELLTNAMLEKLKAWRDVAEQLNGKDVLTKEDLDAYFTTDNAFMKAKREWESYLKELYQR